MSKTRQPDETCRVAVNGGEVAVYSYGAGERVLLCLHGGPGLPCDYVRDSHSVMANHGYRVVVYDQLGCGQSDKPGRHGALQRPPLRGRGGSGANRAWARPRPPPRAVLGNVAGNGILPEVPGQRRVVCDRQRLRQRAAHRLGDEASARRSRSRDGGHDAAPRSAGNDRSPRL